MSIRKWVVVATLIIMSYESIGIAEQVIAGWDQSLDVGRISRGKPQKADKAASGVEAFVRCIGKNPARIEHGSNDLTFGSFTGADDSTDKKTGSQVMYDGSILEFAVVNNGESSLDLSSFHFDYYRAYANGTPILRVEAIFGRSVPVMLAEVNLKVSGKGLGASCDFQDVDLSLAELKDRKLAPEENVVFRITAVGGVGCQVDNFALIGEFSQAGVSCRIVPKPKRFSFQAEFVPIPVCPVRLNDFAAGMFSEEMAYLGHPVDVQSVSEDKFFCVWGNVNEAGLFQALENVKEHSEAYVLNVTTNGVGVAAVDKKGLFHGVQSLLQLLEQSDGRLPVCTVEDWPDYSFRGFHHTLRSPEVLGDHSLEQSVKTYEWMIRRLARYKYTHLNLLLKGTLAFECYPELGMGPWTSTEIRHLIRFARDRGVAVFPEVKTLGKFFHGMSEERLRDYAHLLEPKKYIGQLDYQAQYHEGYREKAEKLEEEQRALEKEINSEALISGDFKIRNPEVFEFLRPILDEVYELFEHPDLFNIGCDESFYSAIEESSEDRGRFLAAYINQVADYLQAKGCAVMMWDDMLVNPEQFPWFFEAHGGPPLNMWTAADLLDRDIIMACWHYGYTVMDHYPQTYPMVAWLAEKGFPVVGVPWFKTDGMVNLARDISSVKGIGVMGSSWALHIAIQEARGVLDPAVHAKVSGRHELGVFAATAEVSWSPETASQTLSEYDAESWEKKWIELEDESR